MNMVHSQREVLRTKLYGTAAVASAVVASSFLLILAYWYAYGVSPVHPEDAFFGSLTGIGWLATAMTGMLRGRRKDVQP